MYYCISLYDLPLMDIREIIMQRRSSSLTAYFYHPRILGKSAFNAQIDFQMRDKGKWYTNLKLTSDTNVTVNQAVRERIREQLTSMFKPYFDNLIKEGGLW